MGEGKSIVVMSDFSLLGKKCIVIPVPSPSCSDSDLSAKNKGIYLVGTLPALSLVPAHTP